MRKINKDNPLAGFNGDNFNNRCNNWSDFHEEHKEIFEESRSVILTNEQNKLCGYTEVYINEVTDCHIDHYKKKSMFPELTFEWGNLIVAIGDSRFGANHKDSKSGIQVNDYDNIFNPVVDNVENCFDYTTWGEVTPKTAISEVDNQKARKTIEVFNLNHNSLKDRRRNLINIIGSY
ncbi:MAG: retron system putative HNH endonuclease [Candidatus Anammoxibacter sp.]